MLTFDSWAGRTPRQRLELAAQCAARLDLPTRPTNPPTRTPTHPSTHLHIAACRRTRPSAARLAATPPAAARPTAARAAAGCPTAGRPARALCRRRRRRLLYAACTFALGSLTPPRARSGTHAAPCAVAGGRATG